MQIYIIRRRKEPHVIIKFLRHFLLYPLWLYTVFHWRIEDIKMHSFYSVFCWNTENFFNIVFRAKSFLCHVRSLCFTSRWVLHTQFIIILPTILIFNSEEKWIKRLHIIWIHYFETAILPRFRDSLCKIN